VTRAMEIRDFRVEDGEACHQLRRGAFLEVFSSFLPADAVRTGAESYSVAEFTRRIHALETFVAVALGGVVGFCSVRMVSPTRAELLYLYVSSGCQMTGVGSQLVRHAEWRVSVARPELTAFFLDTAVPEYNQSFWEHMGYVLVGPSSCEYPSGKIPAVRLEKHLNR